MGEGAWLGCAASYCVDLTMGTDGSMVDEPHDVSGPYGERFFTVFVVR